MTRLRLAGKIARAFIQSKLTPLTVVAALLLGALAIMKTPREEEPQIIVPMLDVMVQMPGATPQEVEQRVSIPMEKFLREIPGVEYLYSISHPGMSVIIVRFYVGTKEEDAIVKTYNKLYENFDKIPPGVSQPIIKVRSIDNVPILALTLWGANYDPYRLRLVAGELEHTIKQIDDVSETTIIGGQPRTIRVVLDTEKLAAYGLTPAQVVNQLQAANSRQQAGGFAQDNRQFQVEAGTFLSKADDLKSVVAGVRNGRPVYLRDVVEKIEDGPAEPSSYVLYGDGAGATRAGSGSAQNAGMNAPAVTITVAKRKGTNATLIAEKVMQRMDQLRGNTIPSDLHLTVTRNYGETAKDKSNELLKHLLLATLSVTLLIALALGWRESGVVLLAVPVTLALTLAIFYLYGYTLNRVTLFALIFSIGILVDDAIVVVENIVRHFRLPENRGRPLHQVAVEAVDEVGNPTILATFTVIAAILPMAFVRGLMGPYMRPIPVGASAAMLFSLAVAFVVSPWAALRLLRHYADTDSKAHGHSTEGWMTRLYRRIMEPLIASGKRRMIFLAGIVVLLLAACTLVPLKLVHVKMLPFDNKSEFQVVIDMPDGTTLEQTTRVAQELGAYLAKQPEVLNYQVYSGTAGPYNFNGLVRHYYLRNQPNQADIQVNLLPRSERSAQSHEIARRLRPGLQQIAQQFGARIKVSEVPPGPPVLQTLVAEVYGPDYKGQTELAAKIKDIFKHTPGAGREAACRGGEVVVVHAYPPPVGGIDEKAREAAQATADFGAAVLRRHHPGLPVRSQATAGAAHEVLATAARCADLLVLGARGDDGTVGPALGSVAVRTLARTPCPTMVVRGLRRDPRGLVLAAVDVGDPADQVLTFGFVEARLRSAGLQVLSACDLTEVRTALDDPEAAGELCDGILAEAAAELDRIVKERQDRCARVRASSRLVEGPATAVLTTASEHADAIVSGAHRIADEKRGTRVGPVTEVLLRHAACPVIVVPYA